MASPSGSAASLPDPWQEAIIRRDLVESNTVLLASVPYLVQSASDSPPKEVSMVRVDMTAHEWDPWETPLPAASSSSSGLHTSLPVGVSAVGESSRCAPLTFAAPRPANEVVKKEGVGDSSSSQVNLLSQAAVVLKKKKKKPARITTDSVKLFERLDESPWYDWGLQPRFLRLPAAHRYRHYTPKVLRHMLKIFPNKWREHGLTNTDRFDASFKALQNIAYGRHASESDENNSLVIFGNWLRERHLQDMRVLYNVTHNLAHLLTTTILPGLTWDEIQGKPQPPTSVIGDRWHLFLTDFQLDTFASNKHFMFEKYGRREDGTIRKPSTVWMRYHGLNLYSLSTVLGTNFLMPSEENVKGMETACGRGIYTSSSWEKALGYSVPHILPGSNLVYRAIALLIVPPWRRKLGSH